MGKIFYLMGKSSSGKDTIYKDLVSDKELQLNTIVMYTTRPIREGETDGVEYYFSSEDELRRLLADGKIIELRAYNTVHGVWKYFTVNDEQIQLAANNYAVIGTLVSYEKMRDYFGAGRVIPIYIEVEDGVRLQRALDRERRQKEPKYAEMCRRFLADSEDFSEDKLEKLGIGYRFVNQELPECISHIKTFISKEIMI
ncbi:guanylate kinase [Diplocloster hominis]|uniref:guanylate kinase n=1 Tax=Diplocloster hominis TaxID=3079010 RepID=UPI0031BBBF35